MDKNPNLLIIFIDSGKLRGLLRYSPPLCSRVQFCTSKLSDRVAILRASILDSGIVFVTINPNDSPVDVKLERLIRIRYGNSPFMHDCCLAVLPGTGPVSGA